MGHGIQDTDRVLTHGSAWHNLSTVHADLITRSEIDASKITQNVHKRQLESQGKQVDAWGLFLDNGQFICPSSESYEPHQASTLFDIGDAVIEAQGGSAKYEAAGTLLGNKKVWGLIDLASSLRIGEDQLVPFLLLVTSFDGSVATLMMQTIIRVICNNTLQMALSNKSQNMLRIRHTSRSQQRLIDAKEAMIAVGQDFKNTEDALTFMANRMLNVQAVTNILDQVIMMPVGKPDRVRENKRRDNILDEIIGLYELNDNNAFPEQRGTAYNLLNAITNYTDHLRSTRTSDGQSVDTNRAISAVVGSGQALKTKAYDIIMNASKSLPMRPERSTIVQVLELPAMVETPLLDAILADA